MTDREHHLEEIVRGRMMFGHTFDAALNWVQRAGFGSPAELEAVRAAYEHRIANVRDLKDPRAIIDKGRGHWYAGPEEGAVFWAPVKGPLESALGPAFEDLDRASTKIVSRLANPAASDPFSIRGLVLGYVQSGKTSNFTAVVAKAVDAGYRMVIVLSGIHNGLRRQTQIRLEKDLLAATRDRWFLLTSADPSGDFKARQQDDPNTILTDLPNKRILLVVKKNTAPLGQIKRWLMLASDANRARLPVLLVDDEADQASVDSSRADQENRTAINRLILDILRLLPQHAYVGYTATPFANVLVDPTADDLYPRDFIVDLPRPSAYFGAERLFGREPIDEDDVGADGLDMIRAVPNAEAAQLKPVSRDKRDEFDPGPVASLVEALHWFVMACAVRLERGQGGKHMTMLVHSTLYTDSHHGVGGVLESLLSELRTNLGTEAQLDGLREIWEREALKELSARLDETPIDWEAVVQRLPEVLGEDPAEPGRLRMRVIVDNAKADMRLDYPTDRGTMQVVVGGNTLSRGLTLEGLTVSYFVRATYLYDTLLQMGRWFGYRAGYADMTRIWMTEELELYFRHLAAVEFEIRQDIRRYELEDLTPREFGVQIRTHSSLAVTSPLKMKHAKEIAISFSGEVKQTIFFDRSKPVLDQNWAAGRELLAAAETLASPEVVGPSHLCYRNVAVDTVRAFLGTYDVHENHRGMSGRRLADYIDRQVREGELRLWNVVVVGTKASDAASCLDLVPGRTVPLLNRAPILRDDDTQLAYMKAILTVDDLQLDLPPAEHVARVEDGSLRDLILSKRDALKSRPLLLLYPINKDSTPRTQSAERRPLAAPSHLLGFTIVFPKAARTTPLMYVTAIDPDAGVEIPLGTAEEVDE